MRSPMRTEQIKSQDARTLESRCLSESLTDILQVLPQDRVFRTHFNYKINRKWDEFDKCKVRLVVRGRHMKHKGADGVGDYDDAFSPVPAASSSRTIWLFSVLPPNTTFLLTMSIFLRPLYKVNCYPETVAMETSMFRLHRVMKLILDTFIVSSCHFIAYHQLPMCCIRRWALFWKEKAAKPWGSLRVCGESSLTPIGFYSVRTSMISSSLAPISQSLTLSEGVFWRPSWAHMKAL